MDSPKAYAALDYGTLWLMWIMKEIPDATYAEALRLKIENPVERQQTSVTIENGVPKYKYDRLVIIPVPPLGK